MKSAITPSYVFNAAARTLDLSAFVGFDIKKLYAVINLDTQTLIYAVSLPGYGYTSISGSILTLQFNTTSMNNSDRLQIIYDDINLGQTNNARSLPVVMSSDQTSTVPAQRGSQGVITTPSPQNLFRTTFSSAISGNVDTNFFNLVQTGTAQTVSQTGGNLVITTGTSANNETIIRSNSSFVGPMVARAQVTLSQRIANNNFFVELVDVVGDNLAVTVNSATSITVTIPNNPFTSANVGQSMYVGAVQNIASNAVPGRYTIASVSGNNVNFTVTGWPASGSGTCSLFGWNYYQLVYTGTTATSVNYDSQRRGYASGVTAATINSTASAGHMAVMGNNDGNAYFADQLVASAAGAVQLTQRASRVVNLADENTNLFLQLRTVNGTTAPASNTTWTVGTVSVENYTPTSVVVNDVKPVGPGNQVPVAVTNTPNIGTVSTVTTVSAVTTCSTVTTVGSVTSANLAIPGIITDVTSAAISTTTTTAAFTPTFGVGYTVVVPVTASTGTGQTLDISIEESDDSGTNWFKVYDFPRITGTGISRSPMLKFRGNRVRYVQTVGGTTPSFTRAINRLQISNVSSQIVQLIDRTIAPNTLNSTSPALLVEGCQDFNMSIRITAQTTAATIAIQFSDDGTNWHTSATSITTAVGMNHVKVQNEQWKFARAFVSAAGTGVTLDYLRISGLGC